MWFIQIHTNKFPRKSHNFQVSSPFCIWLYSQISLATCNQSCIYYYSPPFNHLKRKSHMIKSTGKSIWQNTVSIHNIELSGNTDKRKIFKLFQLTFKKSTEISAWLTSYLLLRIWKVLLRSRNKALISLSSVSLSIMLEHMTKAITQEN